MNASVCVLVFGAAGRSIATIRLAFGSMFVLAMVQLFQCHRFKGSAGGLFFVVFVVVRLFMLLLLLLLGYYYGGVTEVVLWASTKLSITFNAPSSSST